MEHWGMWLNLYTSPFSTNSKRKTNYWVTVWQHIQRELVALNLPPCCIALIGYREQQQLAVRRDQSNLYRLALLSPMSFPSDTRSKWEELHRVAAQHNTQTNEKIQHTKDKHTHLTPQHPTHTHLNIQHTKDTHKSHTVTSNTQKTRTNLTPQHPTHTHTHLTLQHPTQKRHTNLTLQHTISFNMYI